MYQVCLSFCILNLLHQWCFSRIRNISNIWQIEKNQLCIFVTHRLSNIGSSDQIIVLDKGVVIEQGVHKDLIKRDGKYKKLFDTQVSLYKKGGIEEC